MGRPRKPDNAKRNIQVKTYLSSEEAERLQEVLGMATTSNLIRRLVMSWVWEQEQEREQEPEGELRAVG